MNVLRSLLLRNLSSMTNANSHQYFGYLLNVFFEHHGQTQNLSSVKNGLLIYTPGTESKFVKKHGHKLLEMRVQLLGDRRNCQRHSRSLGGNLVWNVAWFSLGHRLEDSFGYRDHWSSSSHRTQTVQGNTHAYKKTIINNQGWRLGVKFKRSVFLVWIKNFHRILNFTHQDLMDFQSGQEQF